MKSDHSSDMVLSMNLLQRSLIEKVGHDNGFEYVQIGNPRYVALASALHSVRVHVTVLKQGFEVRIDSGSAMLVQELVRTFAASQTGKAVFVLPSEAQLARWLCRVAALAKALPNQAVTAFEQQVQAELSELDPTVVQNTEVLRMVRQRVGQQAYRHAMLDYWGGACAVTGLTLTTVLRASHAKPWAECDDDAERLDVFNGLLLAPHLDALFDQFLISFDEQGYLLIAPQLGAVACSVLGCCPSMRMRWVAKEHHPYITYHRRRFLAG